MCYLGLGSLWGGPKDSPPPGIPALVQPLPFTSDRHSRAGVMDCHCWDEGIERLRFRLAFSLFPGSLLALGEARSHGARPSHVSKRGSPSPPFRPGDSCSPGDTLTAALWEVLSQIPPAQLQPDSWPTETVRNVFWFQRLSFRTSWYTATGNWHSGQGWPLIKYLERDSHVKMRGERGWGRQGQAPRPWNGNKLGKSERSAKASAMRKEETGRDPHG